ncbi:MAG TPA: ATP-binding protein [Bryobacteraceae bacterium]|nr:ATP-binding protein [Bryobacteraceae bacterium]
MSPAANARRQFAANERPFIARLRLRAQRRILWMRELWAESGAAGAQGLAITDAEVDRILQHPGGMASREAEFYRTNTVARELTRKISEADSLAGDDVRWNRLISEFRLSSYERDLLSLAVTIEIDPWWRRVCGYLHDDATASQATLWLASGLFSWDQDVQLGPDSALVRWQLARPVDTVANTWSTTAPWQADPQIISWLLDRTPHEMPAPHEECLYPDILESMRQFVDSVAEHDAEAPVAIELIGPEGSGRQTLAEQFAAIAGKSGLFVADARLLPSGSLLSLSHDQVIRAARSARLAGSVLYWRNVEAAEGQTWSALDGAAPVTIFGVTAPLPVDVHSRTLRRAIRLPALSRKERCALWERIGQGEIPVPVSDWALTPGEIAKAASAAGASRDTVTEVCRAMLHQAPGELFAPLPLPYTSDDIVLTATLRAHLDELETQARLRFAVLEDWGFERLLPMGRGLTALFAGPSGTGKTMAAQVLARSLGMDLYRVDLAGVVNKYIGETEKRLKRVFEACERSNVLLLFDEADALFGQRMQVKDAHDRFANIEIDYLLQRMEQFNGIAILATNRKEDLDKAFLRRLRFIVDFLPPGPAERLELWHKSLQPRTPAGEEILGAIDWELLAAKLILTGADIKAAALNAAFLARAANSKITMQHILSAVKRQMSKHGQVLRGGDWEAGRA